jgi:hypothetical protein
MFEWLRRLFGFGKKQEYKFPIEHAPTIPHDFVNQTYDPSTFNREYRTEPPKYDAVYKKPEEPKKESGSGFIEGIVVGAVAEKLLDSALSDSDDDRDCLSSDNRADDIPYQGEGGASGGGGSGGSWEETEAEAEEPDEPEDDDSDDDDSSDDDSN